jgi:hypothetical protein
MYGVTEMAKRIDWYRLAPVVLLAFGLGACGVLDVDSEPADVFEIHLQGAFEGNDVRVEYDGRVVYDGVARTDERIGLASSIPVDTNNGIHFIRVRVDGKVTAHERVTVTDTLYVGVTYNVVGEKAIGFRFSKQQFGYL